MHAGPLHPPLSPSQRWPTKRATTQESSARRCASLAYQRGTAIAEKPTSSSHHLGKQENPTSHNYCKHWCHHGTCKFGYNCRYDHVMPATMAGLQSVGLNSTFGPHPGSAVYETCSRG